MLVEDRTHTRLAGAKIQKAAGGVNPIEKPRYHEYVEARRHAKPRNTPNTRKGGVKEQFRFRVFCVFRGSVALLRRRKHLITVFSVTSCKMLSVKRRFVTFLRIRRIP